MTKIHRLRDDQPAQGNIDPEIADMEAAVEESLASDAEPSVDGMIQQTSASITGMLSVFRRMISGREARIAQAHANYEKAEKAARQLRDDEVEKAEAELLQLRYTVEAVEPARAKLAERV